MAVSKTINLVMDKILCQPYKLMATTISNLSLKHTKRSLRRDIKWLSEIVTLRNKPIIMLYMPSPCCFLNLHMFKNCNASEPFVVKIMYR